MSAQINDLFIHATMAVHVKPSDEGKKKLRNVFAFCLINSFHCDIKNKELCNENNSTNCGRGGSLSDSDMYNFLLMERGHIKSSPNKSWRFPNDFFGAPGTLNLKFPHVKPIVFTIAPLQRIYSIKFCRGIRGYSSALKAWLQGTQVQSLRFILLATFHVKTPLVSVRSGLLLLCFWHNQPELIGATDFTPALQWKSLCVAELMIHPQCVRNTRVAL